jgi:hypothetical protein
MLKIDGETAALTPLGTAREPGSAVTELLTEAAAQSDGPRYLRTGVQVAAGISGDTDEAWREALAMPEVRPSAAAELNRRAGRDFWDNPLPGLEPIHCDSAVMPHTASSPPTKATRIRQRSQGRCARKPAGPPRPPCSGRCGGPGTKSPTRRLPSSASTTQQEDRESRPRRPPQGILSPVTDGAHGPSSPALEVTGSAST